MANNWGEIIGLNGIKITNGMYISKYGQAGGSASNADSFTQNNPGASIDCAANAVANRPLIFSAGHFGFDTEPKGLIPDLHGLGMNYTKLRMNVRYVGVGTYAGYLIRHNLKNMSVELQENVRIVLPSWANCQNVRFLSPVYCRFQDKKHSLVTNCIFTKSAYTISSDSGSLTFINCTFSKFEGMISHVKHQMSLHDRCDIDISSLKYVDDGSSIAFNDCRFRANGNEAYTPIELAEGVAPTIDNLRAAFLKKWGGLITANIIRNFVFSSQCCDENSIVIKGSELGTYSEVRYGAHFGHSTPNDGSIPIQKVNDTVIPYSFNDIDSQGASEIEIENKSISLSPNISSNLKVYNVASTWLKLGGLKRMKDISITHNIPEELGNMVSTSSLLSLIPNDLVALKADTSYVIRSKDDKEATVTYAGNIYSSNLSSNKHVIRGIENQVISTKSNNAVLYQVLDLACMPTIDLRPASPIDNKQITSLKVGVWYFVVPVDTQNPSGHIKYGSIYYPPYSSFLADSRGINFIADQCRLMEILAENMPFVTCTINNLQAVYENSFTSNIKSENNQGKVFIGSAHPDFADFNSGISGKIGIVKPVFGTFIQIRVGIGIGM